MKIKSNSLLLTLSWFADRIQYELDTCTACGSFSKGDSLFCAICEIQLLKLRNESKERSITFENLNTEIPVNSVFPWNPQQSDGLSSLLLKLKGCRREAPYRYWARQILLERIQNSIFLEDPETILIPSPARNKEQQDHAYKLTKALSDMTGWRLHNPLVRDNVGTQKTRNLSQRRRIRLGNPEKFTTSQPIIFVDDVVTTGATAIAAYRSLGCPKNFEVWCLAYRGSLASLSLE